MRSIYSTSTDIYANLASEEYFLKNTSDPVFMLCLNDPAVVVGRYQDIQAEVNLDYAKQNSISIARRISGGGAVFHDRGNFNLTFIDNSTNPEFGKYTDRIISFLREWNIPARADERMGITVDGLKVSGSAQYIYKQRLLFHATLLYASDLEMLAQALDVPSSQMTQGAENRRRSIRSVHSPVANISGFMENPLSVDQFGRKLFEYFAL